MPDPDNSDSAAERNDSASAKANTTTAVRYGKMNHVGEFRCPPDVELACEAKVVISTDRGIEIGEQLGLTCLGCDMAGSLEQMHAYAEASEGDTYRLNAGRILRKATEGDLAELRHIADSTPDRLGTARQLAQEFDLDMSIVDCEQILGGERIIFYFMADQRIDFRQLVRSLASEFQTRIEMRQVGARDEARLLADYETCGRECCCKNFLKTLKPVNMAMAKLQKTTLDLAKVSGRCGRLKCCLRYEHESYESLDKKLPRTGTWISTSHGIGRIVDRQILTQLVKIQTEEGRLIAVPIEDIIETDLPPPPPPPAPSDPGADRKAPSSAGNAAARPAPSPASMREAGPGEAAPQPAAAGQTPPLAGEPPPPPDAPASDAHNAEPSGRSKRRRRGKRRRRRGRTAQNNADRASPGPSANP